MVGYLQNCFSNFCKARLFLFTQCGMLSSAIEVATGFWLCAQCRSSCYLLRVVIMVLLSHASQLANYVKNDRWTVPDLLCLVFDEAVRVRGCFKLTTLRRPVWFRSSSLQLWRWRRPWKPPKLWRQWKQWKQRKPQMATLHQRRRWKQWKPWKQPRRQWRPRSEKHARFALTQVIPIDLIDLTACMYSLGCTTLV